jgi:alkyl hydroperoxide reductase subunit AhpC
MQSHNDAEGKEPRMISEGQTAPDFTLPRDGGGTVTLSSFRPGKVVLYFYPKDDTPGWRRRISTRARPTSQPPGPR